MAAQFKGYDLVLGYLWLREADPRIRFATGNFEWWPEGESRIDVVSAENLLSNIQPGEKAYVLHPGNLACSTLQSGKLNSEQSSALHQKALGMPEGSQVVQPSGPSGDVVLDAEWFNRHGLLWLKNLTAEVCDHL